MQIKASEAIERARLLRLTMEMDLSENTQDKIAAIIASIPVNNHKQRESKAKTLREMIVLCETEAEVIAKLKEMEG